LLVFENSRGRLLICAAIPGALLSQLVKLPDHRAAESGLTLGMVCLR
jgi:hypothetical protein